MLLGYGFSDSRLGQDEGRNDGERPDPTAELFYGGESGDVGGGLAALCVLYTSFFMQGVGQGRKAPTMVILCCFGLIASASSDIPIEAYDGCGAGSRVWSNISPCHYHYIHSDTVRSRVQSYERH